jgi:hypothetical protein
LYFCFIISSNTKKLFPMKKLLLLFSCFLLNFNSFSQITIAQWNFDASTAVPTTTATNTTATNVVYGSGITGTITYPGGNPSTGKGISNTGWNVTAIDLTKYLEVTITPNANWAVNFNDFKFDSFRSSTGATTWAVRTSGDNFGANVASGAVNTTFSTNTISINGASFQNINTQFKLRIYGFGASASGGTFRVDNITFTGTVINTLPTLTATTINTPAFNYVLGSGPSTAGSYTLSGAALTPTAGDITVTAPTNFEVSKTGVTTEFTDNLLIPYTGGAFTTTTIYARLKAGLAVNSPNPPYSGNITNVGGGANVNVALSGSVTAVPPPVITATGTLSTLYTLISTPSASQSYTVSGVNLVSDITITAPTDFEIKTSSATTYANTLMLTPSSGNVPTTTIDVRLKGTNTGTFSGNISHASTNVSPNVNVAINGKVGAECGTTVDIASFRTLVPVQQTYPGTAAGLGPKIIAGIVTAVFEPNKFYVQDATGGIAVFSSGVVTSNNLVIGDQVKLTGTPVRFNGEVQMNNLTCMTKISSGTPLTPLVFDANNPPASTTVHDFMCANEGRLIKIISSNFSSSGTFTSAFNYGIVLCNLQDATEVRIDAASTGLIGTTIPNTVTQDITGVLGRFVQTNTSNVNTADKLQIFPRNLSDLTTSGTSCASPSTCGVTTYTDSPTQLDIMNWNIEWLGHPSSSNGPSNKALQQTNAQSVLNGAGADVYMLQEICQYNPANPTDNTTSFGKLIEGLNNTFGVNTYSGECSSAFSTSFVDPNAQRVCVIYKNSVVTKIFSRPMFDGFTPATYPPTGTPSQFWASGRKPFMFMAKVNINSQIDTVLLVGLHAKAGSALDDYARRKYDVKAMYDTLQAQYPTRKTIVIGDLNDDVDKSIATTACNQLVSSYAPFLYTNPNETAVSGTRPNPSWNPISKVLSDSYCASTASFTDYIDHQIVSNEMNGTTSSGYKYVPASVTSFRPIVSNYASTTSDHYPTIARYQYFTLPITSIATGNWSSPSTWDCTCVPTAMDNVVIDTPHTVTVDAASQAKSINLKGVLNYLAPFVLSLGQ